MRRVVSGVFAVSILFTFNQCVQEYEEVQVVDKSFEAVGNEAVENPHGNVSTEIDDFIQDNEESGPITEEADIVPEEEQETGGTVAARTASSVGVLNFEQIDASFSALTGVDRRDFNDVNQAYVDNFLALPGNNSVKEFNASNTMAVFKVASAYCSRMSREAALRDAFFNGIINVGQTPNQALSNNAQKGAFIDGMIARLWGMNVDEDMVMSPTKVELLALVDELLADENLGAANTTRIVAVGICSAMMSSPQVIYL